MGKCEGTIMSFDQTYTSNGSKFIPANARNIRITASAGSGGNGGNDTNPGGTGGRGRRTTLTFPNYVSRTVSWTVGKRGQTGFGCVSGSGGGNGGAGAASGGRGGNTGPQGCSGGGGGGGGSTSVSDNIGGLLAILGGGGGAGGGSHPDSFLLGGNGGNAGGMNSGNGSSSGGGTGSSQGLDGGGGGGGGAGSPGGGGGREGADDRAGGYPSIGGSGGSSWYNSTYISYTNTDTISGDGSVRVQYDLANPVISSFSANPTPIISGDVTTLSWTTQFATTGQITPGNINATIPNGSVQVSPADDQQYILTITGLDGVTTVSQALTVVVYIPPVLYFTLSRTSIIVGESATLSWYATGDANTITWLSGGITNTNLNSSVVVSPTSTTTYSARVSGLGGTSPVESVTLTVYQRPTLSVDYPTSLDYGTQGTIEYTATYTNTSLTLTPTYYYLDGVTVAGDPVQLTRPSSAELGIGTTEITSNYTTTIPYTDRGPLTVAYTIEGTGNGGTVSSSDVVIINIDDTPDNLGIQSSEDLIKDQEPIITPEVEVLTDQYLVDGVDIDVEIKSNYPIQVQVNNDNVWENVREL